MNHRLPAMLVVIAVVFAALPAAVAFSASAAVQNKADVIIGFKTSVDSTSITSLGGTMTKKSDHLRLAGARVPNTSAFMSAILRNPNVAFVEPNGYTTASGAGWDSAGWDSAGWDGTGWNSAGWDSAGWDSAGWDSAGWDSAGWDSAGWDSAGWDSAGWDSAGWDSAGWDQLTGFSSSSWGTHWASINWSSAGWDGAGWDGAGWDGTGWNGAGWDGSLYDTSWLASKATGGAPGTDPLSRYQWGWNVMNFTEAAARTPAGDRTICVVDSGVDYTHPDLASDMWRDPTTGFYGYDFVNNDNDPMDDGGHGTHVAGIAAAATGNGLGVAAGGANEIMAVKVLDNTGSGRELDLALGITWCVDHGARVVSLSLSTDQDSMAVHNAVIDAVNRGAVVVAAAGNTGHSGAIRYPAAYPEVISVAAIMPNGIWAPFSTVARYVDVSAPGFAIVSTYMGGGYMSANGTSMATPFVSATAAMVLAANPHLNASAVKAVLGRSALDLGPKGPDDFTGFGMVRADYAVFLASHKL